MPLIAALFSKVGLQVAGYAALAAAIVAGFLYVAHLRESVASLTEQNAAAVAAAKTAVDLMTAHDADNARAIAALQKASEQTAQIVANTSRLHSEIQHAPASDDAALAPVLRDLLRELQPAAGAAAPGRRAKAAGAR